MTVDDTAAAAAAAKGNVDRAEADIASGSRSITAAALHKLRDAWRHADLAAKGERARAEQVRAQARLDGLAAVGAEVDKLAESDETTALADAIRAVAATCARVRQLVKAHDAAVAELAEAARDLGAEPIAPGGPRRTSARVGVIGGRGKGDSMAHERIVVSPVGDHLRAALEHALGGDPDRAVAEIQPVTVRPERKRPDHLIRNRRSGNIIAMTAELNAEMLAQIRSGDIEELFGHDVDLYMEGELG